ncbi:sporulation YhaL family protein [Bacillus sp. NEB1478]|uniref:sporulation YhaL family protein n=1 Tax=Bacillus sp. NEB1478 TaxID=3073816 RepID=UPI0028732FA4|nr:sporulation YhaL family protein [Bacillus sp. NEB1478]WNB91452.1 sporulation YhaL family protein [Bacillus sp. NEB1478]
MKGYAALFFGAILIAAFVLKEYAAGVGEIFIATPWWMYFVLCGIIYSGYRSVISFQEDRERELRLIEEEGKVYMERIEKAMGMEQQLELALNENRDMEEAGPRASGE